MKIAQTYKFILPLLFVVAFFAGCEEQMADGEDFPFELKLVVRGLLTAGEPVEDIYIGRTLPVTFTYSESFANLEDASAVIVYEDSLILLHHTGEGLYSPQLPLIAEKGKHYSLVVQWENKTATAETTIPWIGTIGKIQSLRTTDGDNKQITILECDVTHRKDEIYAPLWAFVSFSGRVNSEANEFGTLGKRDPNYAGAVKCYTSAIKGDVNSTLNLGVHFYIYDSPFYDYFYTQGSSQIEDAIFGQSSSNVRWNVKGDGIGMFIGRCDTVIVL